MKIVSGGQTGADRAGLDFAIECGISRGGWCPKERKAIDGPIDSRYQLTETPTGNYLQRTEWNARDSEATVIFRLTEKLAGGSKRTAEFATKHGKPWIHIHAKMARPENLLDDFMTKHTVTILNIAGSREAAGESVYQITLDVLKGWYFYNVNQGGLA